MWPSVLPRAASVFARTPGDVGGRYAPTGTADVNTYALFAELLGSIGRRTGIIVPTGIATERRRHHSLRISSISSALRP
jgi:hypothetical protein